MTNFDALGFVPLGCVTSDVTFYHKLAVKVFAPLVIIGLLWCYPLSKALHGQPNEEASRTIKRVVLLMLELVLPSITTSLIQVFICSKFDNGSFLREELTLSCDDSGQRARWVAFTVAGLLAYPLGGKCSPKSTQVDVYPVNSDPCASTVPTLIFTTMYSHRHAIQKLGTEMQQYNQPRGTRLNANQLIKSKQARGSFVSLTAEVRWLLPKFEKFSAEYWFFGIVQLALRLLQTSFMALVPSQYIQVTIVCDKGFV